MSKNESCNQLEKRKASEVPAREQRPSGRTYSPNVDIVESQDQLIMYADMPGVSADNIDIHFENGELSIFGRVANRPSGNEQYLLREYGVGNYHRTFQVSEAVDSEKISAEYADGVLALHLPKAEAAKPRRIKVKAS